MKNTFLLIVGLFLYMSGYGQKEYKALMSDPSVNFYDVCASAEAYFQTHGKEKGSGWKGYQRWKAANEYKYYPSGVRSNVDPYFVENGYKSFLNHNVITTYPTGWKSLGPDRVDSITGQYSVGIGQIKTVYVDPADSMTMYIGSRSGGFWRTVNGGQTWQCTTDTLVATGVNTIAVSPTNSDSVLINIQNAGNNYSYGIYRSTDGGITWSLTNFNASNVGFGGLGSNFRIYKIAYHPRVPGLIFIGTNKGLYKSTNNLQSWTRMMNSGVITDIAFHPSNDSIIYIYNSYYWSGYRDKVYVSTNQGASYSATTITGNNNATGHLSTSPVCDSCLYFASDNGVWKSTDNGQSFSFLSNPNEGCIGFAVNDQDTSNMIYGYVDIQATNNGGQSFSKVTHWSLGNTNGSGSGFQASFQTSTDYVHADLHIAICVNGVFYVGTDGWFAKSSDGGNNWQILNQGTCTRENYRLGLSQSNHFRSISGSQDNGTSIKHQTTWIEYYGADGMEGIVQPLNDNYMIGSVQYGTRRRTKDGGQNSESVTPTTASSAQWVAPLAYDPNDQMRIFDFRDSIYVSDDFGDTWTVRGKPASLNGDIMQAAIAENNSQIIVVSRYEKIDKSTDGGYNFTSIKNNLPGYTIQDIAFDPNDDNTMVVVYGRYQADNKKVFITHNGGQSWTNITYNLGNMPVRSVVIDHSNAHRIYLGAEIGVYTMAMGGNSWTLYNTGLPNVTVQEMEINYGSNSIKAATWGRGLWEYTLAGRNNFPSILKTRITDAPTATHPIEGMSQYVTSVISYSGMLTSVYVKWAKDSILLSNTIAMTNTIDSTWVSSSPFPNFTPGSKIYFKVYAVGNNGDTSETYRFMYTIHPFAYCNATGNNNGGNLFISNLSLANINNQTVNNAYTYYPNLVVYLYRDSTYTIDIYSNTGWSSNDFGAWIDFDRNALFDTSEALNLTEVANNHAQGTFTVPHNAVITDTVRLRVRLSYWGSQAMPCGNTLGEVEDYPVMIKIIDTMAPVPDTAVLTPFSAECVANPPVPTATDNISGTVYGVPNPPLPLTTLGTTMVVWTYTDANGNSSQQSQNVTVLPVDTSVMVSGDTLTAVSTGYSYQWVDCQNAFSSVSGAVYQSFVPSQSGIYAVVLFNNYCRDTSSCHTVYLTGMKDIKQAMNVEVYPNPTGGKIMVRNDSQKPVMLEITDLTGRKLQTVELKGRTAEIDLSDYSSQIYIFKFYNKEQTVFLKVVKE